MDGIIKRIREELKGKANEDIKKGGERFFKEQVNFYGMKTPDVSKIAKAYFKEIEKRSKAEIFALCDELWKSGYMEESFIACTWSYAFRKQYEPKDFVIFEKWVKEYVGNWAACDTLCNHTVGAFIEMYPDYLMKLKKWAKSSNRWVRRASAVSLIIPAKNGKFLKDVFQIADILLSDKDDMVQKGYGWMLKAASQAHQEEVFEYVLAHKTTMPRTALRYAIEKMRKEMKKRAMEK